MLGVECIETSSFIVECSPDGEEFRYKTLTITNKLHNRNCKCRQPDQRIFNNVTFWR